MTPPSEFFAPPLPRMLAHRGLATGAPENTLGAFRAAVDAGATYLETDVHATSDGVAVISHDPDLGRVSGTPAVIRESTHDHLRAIDLGVGERVPTLYELLVEFPQQRINIDVKAPNAAGPAAEAILRAGATDRVLVTSFDSATRLDAVRRLPGVATSASARTSAWAIAAARFGLTPLVRRTLRDVDAVQLPERRGRIVIITSRFVQAMHAVGTEVHVWTVNDSAAMTRLLRLGVDGIFTDRYDIAADVVRNGY